jgi:hypothetical protein
VTDLEAAIEREVVPGTTTLGELGAAIGAPSWLDDGAVTIADAGGGKLPVSSPDGGTVATVGLPAERAVLYVAVDAILSADEMAAGLRGEPGADRASAAIVLDVAVCHSG